MEECVKEIPGKLNSIKAIDVDDTLNCTVKEEIEYNNQNQEIPDDLNSINSIDIDDCMPIVKEEVEGKSQTQEIPDDLNSNNSIDIDDTFYSTMKEEMECKSQTPQVACMEDWNSAVILEQNQSDDTSLLKDKMNTIAENILCCNYNPHRTLKKKDFVSDDIIYTENISSSCNQCHKSTHTKEKSYSCDQCTYRTSQRSNLKRHKRSHTGEKPFSCDQCTYKTSRKINVVNHKRTHTGDKPFKCDQCSYRTSQKSNLKRHKTSHQIKNLSTLTYVLVELRRRVIR